MPPRLHLLDLPLLLTGIPAAVQDWLRQAGLPMAPLRLREGLGQGKAKSGRIVLYDGRSVGSRHDADAARAAGLKTIDVAALLKSKSSAAGEDRLRGRFLGRLKQAVESSGGLWARLADYPSPWQCAVCRGELDLPGDFARIAERFVPLGASRLVSAVSDSTVLEFPSLKSSRWPEPDANDDLAATLERCYSAGQPMSWPHSPDVLDDADAEIPAECIDAMPLLWRTSLSEFAQWWRLRERWTVRIERQGATFRIECDGPAGPFRPMLELWQGGHAATVPLRTGEMLVRRDGLVFQENSHRHPAGFTALAVDSTNIPLDDYPAPQTA